MTKEHVTSLLAAAMTKCFLHPWPVVSAPFRCSWQSLVTEEQFTNKSLACKCSILAVFIPYQLLVLFTAKVISWNCSGKVPNGCDSTCGSMHFLWVQMCLGCMVFCRKARTTPKVVWERIEKMSLRKWIPAVGYILPVIGSVCLLPSKQSFL